MKIIPVQQGSIEWMNWRKGHLGASDAGTIMRLNPYDTRKRLWEEKVMGTQKECSASMRRGTLMEPEARIAYELETGYCVKPVVAESYIATFLGASFDGMTDDFQHAVEIKCGKRSYEMAKDGIIPEYYMAQLQHQMLVSHLSEIDYWAYDGNVGILINIKLDHDFIDKMLEEEIKFWHHVTSVLPPED